MHVNPTYKFRHGVMFTFCFNGAGDAVIFQDGEEQLHKVRGVRRSDDIQYLGAENTGSLPAQPPSGIPPTPDKVAISLEKATLPSPPFPLPRGDNSFQH